MVIYFNHNEVYDCKNWFIQIEIIKIEIVLLELMVILEEVVKKISTELIF